LIAAGFVLATFPPAEIQNSPFAKEIMKKIGSLSAYELVSAVPCFKCLRKMAETAVDIIDGVSLEQETIQTQVITCRSL